MWLLAIALDSVELGDFHHNRKYFWMMLVKKAALFYSYCNLFINGEVSFSVTYLLCPVMDRKQISELSTVFES